MKTRVVDSQEWWAGRDEEKRAFFRDVMRLAEGVEEGEVLRLEFNGHNFTPTLFGDRRGRGSGRETGGPDSDQSADAWWAGLSGGMRALVPVLAGLVGELVRDRDKVIEVRRTEGGFKATLVLRLRRPMGGVARMN